MLGTETLRNLIKSILAKLKYNDYDIEITAVSSEGANYTSRLYNITVVDKHKDTLHLFAKVAIMSDKLRQQLEPLYVYNIEDNVYRTIATAYEQIQDKHEIPKNERFIFPKFYGSSIEAGHETFIFENLNLKGYQIFDRFNPLDYQSMFDGTTTLAKFHALGLAAGKETPELFKQFDSIKLVKSIDKFVDSSHDNIQKYIETLDEHEIILKFLEDGGFDKYKKYMSHKGKFLIHGDYRGSNIMYKKEGDKILIVPVDYQGVCFGCPLTDLLYFITTGTDEAFRVQYFDELVEHYYTQLSLYLSKLDIDVNDVYPKQTFQDELKELLPATLTLALVLFPLIFVKKIR